MSYAFLGYKWGVPDFGQPSGEITWSADLADLPFDDAIHDLSDFDAQIASAFQAWEDVAAIDFRQVASGGDVQVSVDFLENPLWVAVTEWSETRSPGLEQFQSVSVTFAASETWAPDSGDGFDLQNFYSVATHEIGHVIGLEHVDDPGQIMFATTLGPDALQAGDITGAQILYGTDEGDPDLGALPAPPDESIFDESSSGGGGIFAVLIAALAALVAALSGMFTGGTGPLALLAAARSEADDETLDAWGQEALEAMPVIEVADDEDVAEAEDALLEDLLDWV